MTDPAALKLARDFNADRRACISGRSTLFDQITRRTLNCPSGQPLLP